MSELAADMTSRQTSPRRALSANPYGLEDLFSTKGTPVQEDSRSFVLCVHLEALQ